MPTISEALAIIASIVAVIIALRKAPHEMRATDAGAAKVYAEASALAAEQNAKLLERVTTLECEVSRLKKGQNDLGCLLADWMVGINKLVAQIRRKGEQPIWQPNIPEALRMLVLQEAEAKTAEQLEDYLRRPKE